MDPRVHALHSAIVLNEVAHVCAYRTADGVSLCRMVRTHKAFLGKYYTFVFMGQDECK